ncbi:uncharacterized protein TRIADDRAFT_25812 [Trichoplax adhaerens]|uniref:GH18 domain-containing protein n=1 Tax=Trichoplax adhaerens TaxID=10228 RepID=B3RWQ5_TRIAD|nr:hypothetical protein TRIADDRAFT_25812 [Trichoplax adhaerens]EDV25172.1 hypothetical protein TRIADDRAFT_25812 [Trichoplax adhaerens]|eukprot:XP_002113062.1 hypothetical protein TRIADDRAFT_25812 [Trichoplax adhaerens]
MAYQSTTFLIACFLNWLIQIHGIDQCPCHTPSLCKPVQIGPRSEVVAFSVYRGLWKYYDWTHLTTIALFEEQLPNIDPNLLCYAHSHHVRLVPKASFPVQQLTNKTHIDQWIKDKVKMIKTKFLDGINFDIEQSIPIISPEANDLIKFVNQTTTAIHSAFPGSLVTFDASYWPQCTIGHCYKNVAISKIVDFVITMNYDEEGSLIASANSPFRNTVYSIHAYKKAGAQMSKIVTAQPWYGYNYRCLGILIDDICHGLITRRNVKWNIQGNDDSSKSSIEYGEIEKYLNSNKTSGSKWSNSSQSPYFNYKDAKGAIHQVWYDNPKSLSIKYSYAIKSGIRGIGMWSTDFPNYVQYPKESAAMWKCIDTVLKNSKP